MDGEKDISVSEDKEVVGGGDTPEVPEDEGTETETPENATDSEDVAEDTDEGDTEDEQVENTQEPPKGRANARIQSLRNREKEATERAERAEREMSALRSQMEDVQRRLNAGNAEKDARAEEELLAQMDPVQRVQYESDKRIRGIEAELQRVKHAAIDSQDKATFLASAQNDPVKGKLVDQVEKNLSEMRAKGFNAPREEIYYYLLGKSLVEQKMKSGGKNAEKAAAKARVDATEGKMVTAKGDTPSGRKGKSAEERLEGVIL
ncbi:MAG: hypothetical protein KGL39_11740 [Patescibacteria group bacterium]|nr:hypothetical protein [Patescibacteria group bacterium]